jgi:phosphatidyl-myo-inositol dimannoside synthase
LEQRTKRALVLVGDAFGGRGGIALYARYLLKALCDYPSMERVVAIPRRVVYQLEEMPQNLDFRVKAAGGLRQYFYACLETVFTERRFDLIICGHLHLLPFARLLQIYYRCPMLPVIYGIEAWSPTAHRSVNLLCRQLGTFISIRHLTAQRLIEWAGLNGRPYYYLPNCIEESAYGIRPKRQDLVERYHLRGRTVIATAGRLDSNENERNKGFDEILESLPELIQRIPNLSYLIIGDGEDSERLARKAKSLGVADQVVFTGYVSDHDKADHYRLADVFAMPGSNPKFDRYPYRFVFLEALACGVPVVGCRLDDPAERSDPDAQLITQVDPENKEEIIEAIEKVLSCKEHKLQPRIQHFSFQSFRDRLHHILSETLCERYATRSFT